jgi:hypothetical protein
LLFAFYFLCNFAIPVIVLTKIKSNLNTFKKLEAEKENKHNSAMNLIIHKEIDRIELEVDNKLATID